MLGILKKAKSYSIRNIMCGLCAEEKLVIMLRPEQDNLLNERSEIIATCKHAKTLT